jgi:hypothetical protein
VGVGLSVGAGGEAGLDVGVGCGVAGKGVSVRRGSAAAPGLAASSGSATACVSNMVSTATALVFKPAVSDAGENCVQALKEASQMMNMAWYQQEIDLEHCFDDRYPDTGLPYLWLSIIPIILVLPPHPILIILTGLTTLERDTSFGTLLDYENF